MTVDVRRVGVEKGPGGGDGEESGAGLLLGEQHDTEAGSKLATAQGKINTATLEPAPTPNLVCYFKLMRLLCACLYLSACLSRRLSL